MDDDLRAADLLSAARRFRTERDAAERGMLESAVSWAGLHEASQDDYYATWGDTPIAITGAGAPLIQEMCIAEFASVLGMRTEAGRQFLADAVELAHRLPGVMEQVRAGRVAVFKARRIAQRTSDLSLEGAGFVDRQVAFAAARVSIKQVELLVDEARAKFQPQEAAELARRAAEVRKVVVDTRQVSFWGTSRVFAELDLADALDLDEAVSLLAKQIEQHQPDLTLDACRAKALGALARGELSLPLPAAEAGIGLDKRSGLPLVPIAPAKERVLNLIVHLTSDGSSLDQTVFSEKNHQLLVLEQIKSWCSEATRVNIRPVIDLHQNLSATGYAIPERIHLRVKLRDRRCRFPHCERLATRCDSDHVIPFDPGGPPDQTATDNLASLCRHHHRLKTHSGWTYQTLEPGAFLWCSPHGYQYLVDPTGTQELTPQAVEPRRPAS